MMARRLPTVAAIRVPVQWVEVGATLAATGRVSGAWAEVTAGGHAIWISTKNAKAV